MSHGSSLWYLADSQRFSLTQYNNQSCAYTAIYLYLYVCIMSQKLFCTSFNPNFNVPFFKDYYNVTDSKRGFKRYNKPFLLFNLCAVYFALVLVFTIEGEIIAVNRRVFQKRMCCFDTHCRPAFGIVMHR